MNRQAFDILKGSFTRGEIDVLNYLAFNCEIDSERSTVRNEDDGEQRIILREPGCKKIWPRICIYDYLSIKELKQLNAIARKKDLRRFIDERIPRRCKEPSRSLFTELMYSIIKFSKRNDFDLKQTGALLSQFYLTHMIFTTSYNISAEKIYLYFKEIMICHSVASPPDSIKIFTMEESEIIVNFFCKLYLRNLPLIRTLCLPNFAFHLDTFLESEVPATKKEEKGSKNRKKNKK